MKNFYSNILIYFSSFITKILLGTTILFAPQFVHASACDGQTIDILMETVPDTEAILEMKGEFEAATNSKVNIEAITYSLMHEKLVPSLTASTGQYDVIVVDSYWVGEFKTAGWMEPLDKMLASSSISLDTYIPSIVDINGKVQGTTYMLPLWHYIMGIVYRKDIIESEEFQSAYKTEFGKDWSFPNTLEDFRDVAIWAGKHTGLNGMAMAGQRIDPVVMEATNYLMSLGGDFYDRENWTSTIDSDAAIKAANIYKDLIKNAAQPGALGANFDDVSNTIKQGEAVFGITYLFLWPWFQDPAESQVVDKMGFSPMPGGTPGLLGAWGWAIPSNAENKACSWEFLEWAESKENAYKRAMLGGQPVQSWIYQDAEYIKTWPQMELALEAIKPSLGMPIMSRSTQLIETYGETLAQILTDQMGTEEALKAAKKKMDRLTRNDPLLGK